MFRKYVIAIALTVALLVTISIVAFAKDRADTFRQTGMDMPTETMPPVVTATSTVAPLQASATQPVANPAPAASLATATPILPGYIPYTDTMATQYPMAGFGYMGNTSAMGTGGMGMGGGMMSVSSGTIISSSMGASGMEMGGCPMMSGMDMSGSSTSMNMGGSSAGMNMGGSGLGTTGISSNSSMPGMNMSSVGVQGSNMVGLYPDDYAAVDPSPWYSNPWILLGWILLALVVLAIVVGSTLGIVWVIRKR